MRAVDVTRLPDETLSIALACRAELLMRRECDVILRPSFSPLDRVAFRIAALGLAFVSRRTYNRIRRGERMQLRLVDL